MRKRTRVCVLEKLTSVCVVGGGARAIAVGWRSDVAGGRDAYEDAGTDFVEAEAMTMSDDNDEDDNRPK